jgi:hypothetical protein
MLHAKHLHPEWGVLAPPQNLVRTVRILAMTAAVSAAACAGVILSLVDRLPDQASVAARTLTATTDAPAAAPVQPLATLLGAQVKLPGIVSEPAKAAPSVAARTKPLAELVHPQKKASKKHHTGSRYASRDRQFTSLMDDWYHAVGL